MNEFIQLLKGKIPIERAFWTWAVAGGLIVNLVTSLIFILLLSHGYSILGAIIGYGCSLPYNVIICVGVIRSAVNLENKMSASTSSGKARAYVAITLLGGILLSLT